MGKHEILKQMLLHEAVQTTFQTFSKSEVLGISIDVREENEGVQSSSHITLTSYF